MLSFSSGATAEPSALLSNARSTIATLIQRPSAVTTSNAFDDFAILDNLIDVSNDVDRLDDGENRKFLNIAQLITASTCIYSRRVDALYKLINNFQSATSDGTDGSSSDDDQPADSSISLEPKPEKEPRKAAPSEIRAKPRSKNRSFICQDPSKISLNPTKSFFLDRTSLFDLKLFQTYVPVGNKQFWLHDHRPVIFDLLFDDQALRLEDEPPETERLIDALNRQSPRVQPLPTFDDADIPLPIPMDYDEHESSWQEASIDHRDRAVAKKTPSNHRKKKVQNQLDLNVFRQGLTDQQQALFHCQKTKPLSSKVKHEPGHFFVRTFNRKQFDALIKGKSTNGIPSSLIVRVIRFLSVHGHRVHLSDYYSSSVSHSRTVFDQTEPIVLASASFASHASCRCLERGPLRSSVVLVATTIG